MAISFKDKDWWRKAAACKGMDIDLFFPADTDHATIAEAKAVCKRCPVREACYRASWQWGVSLPALHGIWGGLTPDERRSRRRRETKDVMREELADQFQREFDLSRADAMRMAKQAVRSH